MDLFDSKSDKSLSLNAIIKNDMANIVLNYESVNEFRENVKRKDTNKKE